MCVCVCLFRAVLYAVLYAAVIFKSFIFIFSQYNKWERNLDEKILHSRKDVD